MEKAFGTPRQPVLNSQPRLADISKGVVVAKTPFQANNAYQRSFKSELQPNRVSSRFHTGYRPTTVGRPAVAAKSSVNPLTARLGRFISNKEVPPPPVQPQVTRVPGLTKPPESFARGTATPAANPLPAACLTRATTASKPHYPPTQAQPQPHLQPQPHPPAVHINEPVKPHLAAPSQAQLQVPPTTYKGSNAVTSEPARTHCHTSNRTNHQISRTQSEPSITYQVQVNDKTYKILRKIGSGGSSKVYEGFDPRTSQTVAIKIINVAQADPRTRESYFNEKELLMKLRDSPHVVDMYESEYKTKHNELIIVMEKGDADLAQVIDSYFKKRNVMIDGIFIKFYWRGILQAVNSIHEHGIVHADLKPVNFILVKNEIKLIDFGIANAIAPEGTSVIRDYQIGTINFMAPEALKNRASEISFSASRDNNHPGGDENNPQQHRRTIIKYNYKADIWSLGCILYNLVYGRPPFDKYKDVLSKSQAITDPHHVIEYPKISNPRLLNCLKACLRYNPAERPSALELLNDPYLKEDVVLFQNTPSSQRKLRIG